jgi:hypothetical protein
MQPEQGFLPIVVLVLYFVAVIIWMARVYGPIRKWAMRWVGDRIGNPMVQKQRQGYPASWEFEEAPTFAQVSLLFLVELFITFVFLMLPFIGGFTAVGFLIATMSSPQPVNIQPIEIISPVLLATAFLSLIFVWMTRVVAYLEPKIRVWLSERLGVKLIYYPRRGGVWKIQGDHSLGQSFGLFWGELGYIFGCMAFPIFGMLTLIVLIYAALTGGM